jgi:hypothetical protein
MDEKDIFIKLEVSVTEANLIVGALSELPAKHSMALIQKLQMQAAPQLPAPEPENKEAPKE